ncbi:MAG: efflux RND transporter permease subunit, partial [Verrucomicrobiales bacterium]|nr:efflux RND transporter permease subunit [Verrucomicrobiales bacterium]
MIAWFARNTVASNLLMLAIIFAGGYTLLSNKIPLEVFPEMESNIVNVTVPYRGGTPEEVEESVVVKIEEAIADVEGIEQMISTAGESNGTVMVEVDDDYDRREVLEDIKNRVDAVSTFPPDSEKPVVALADSYHEVITVVLYGALSELDLRRLGENIRDQILNLPGVTRAQLQGVRPYEVSIEIDENTLQRYGLTFDTVATALRNTSIDVPAGTLKTTSGDVVLRTRGRAYSGAEFEKIVIATTPQGSRITLADIATVNDGFNENPFIARYNGERSVVISVAREGTQNAITIANTVKKYMLEREATLPPGVSMTFWSDRSKIVKGRLDTLVKSGLQSMLGVFLLLALFLRPNLAFWVVVGIPVCFLGAIACMPYLGVTINVVSLFGFILVLGVVVDDAIVSGENIYTHHRRGAPWKDAAVTGAREVALPVIFGVLTTMLAFVPLLLGEGFMGRWAGDIAWIVIATLAFSLIESKLILPAHLSHRWLETETFPRLLQLPFNAIDFVQSKFANGLERAVVKLYQPTLDLALRNRYTTIAIFVAAFLV